MFRLRDEKLLQLQLHKHLGNLIDGCYKEKFSLPMIVLLPLLDSGLFRPISCSNSLKFICFVGCLAVFQIDTHPRRELKHLTKDFTIPSNGSLQLSCNKTGHCPFLNMCPGISGTCRRALLTLLHLTCLASRLTHQ